MGWLELLPLMRRALPLLDRLTPMLETAVAGRMGAKGEVDRTNAAVAQMAASHTDLLGALAEHGGHLASIESTLRGLQASHAALATQIAATERKLDMIAASVRIAAIVLGVLLLFCLALLGILLSRHR